MLDPRLVTEKLDEIKAGLARRGFSDEALLDRLAQVAEARRAAVGEVDSLRKERNDASAAMATIADKKSDAFQEKRDALRGLGARIKEREGEMARLEAEQRELILSLPNLPSATTPEGLTEDANRLVRVVGERPEFDFEPRDHVDLGTALGILDFERAAKISRARFAVLRGKGARLERALTQFMLDVHTEQHGYEEAWVPAIVNDAALRGTGQLPKFEEDLFKIAKGAEWEPDPDTKERDFYLIPTAEVPVTNLHAGEILDAEALPLAYCAHTFCFRSEAGSHGRDTRGLIRQHQFDKVELVRFVTPDEAEAQLEALTNHACAILDRLGLHYRVVELCAGDLGFASQKTYDLEVWLPGQQAFREISSCSWFGDFQARRMKTRYRPAPKQKPQLLHTLNGSGLAVGRTWVAILEQYQREDGSVEIPEALRGYMGGAEAIAAG